MNLVDLLAPKMPHLKQGLAEAAEVAESKEYKEPCNPPPLAENGGERQTALEFRRNPPPLAETKARTTKAFPPNPPNPPPITTKSETAQPVTREYFISKGINLLPEDLAFLRWYLPKDAASRNKAILEYIAVWERAASRELLDQRKANRGRFAANAWLRDRHGQK